MNASMPTNAVATTVGHTRLSDCVDFIGISGRARKWEREQSASGD
jgi:hypothetical protein